AAIRRAVPPESSIASSRPTATTEDDTHVPQYRVAATARSSLQEAQPVIAQPATVVSPTLAVTFVRQALRPPQRKAREPFHSESLPKFVRPQRPLPPSQVPPDPRSR